MRLQELQRLVSEIETGADAEGVELGYGRGADAVEFADRQRLKAGPVSGVMTNCPFGLR
jgi:hypothetical protein